MPVATPNAANYSHPTGTGTWRQFTGLSQKSNNNNDERKPHKMQNSISERMLCFMTPLIPSKKYLIFGAYLNSSQITALCYMAHKVNQNKWTYIYYIHMYVSYIKTHCSFMFMYPLSLHPMPFCGKHIKSNAGLCRLISPQGAVCLIALGCSRWIFIVVLGSFNFSAFVSDSSSSSSTSCSTAAAWQQSAAMHINGSQWASRLLCDSLLRHAIRKYPAPGWDWGHSTWSNSMLKAAL